MNEKNKPAHAGASRRRERPCGRAWLLLALTLLAGCARDPDALLERARDLGNAGDQAAAIAILDDLIAANALDFDARILRAELALVAGDAALAEDLLRKAQADGAQDLAVWLPLGRAMLARGDFERLRNDLPRNARSPRYRGELLALHGRADLALGALEEARRTFRTALRIDERCLPALIGIAQVSRAERRYEEAEAEGWRAIRLDPRSVAAWRERGALEFERGRYVEAEQAFERALTTAGDGYWTEDGVAAAAGLAESLWRAGRREAARTRIDELAQHLPRHPLVLYLRALFALDSGDHDGAGQYAHALLSTHGEYPAAFALLGLSALERGDAAAASAMLERAVALRPGDIVARELLARATLASGDAQAAVRALLPAAATGSRDAYFLSLLGRARLRAGGASGGVAALALAAAAREAPSVHADAQDIGGQLLAAMRARRTAEVEALAKRLLSERPDAPGALLAMAQAAEARGERPLAIEWLERAGSGADGAEAQLLLARYALARGDVAAAEAHVRGSVATAPFEAEAHATLGLVRLRAGASAEARRSLRTALLLDPANPARRVDYASAQLAAGDLGRAVATLSRTLRMPDVDVATIAGLVRVQWARGRSTQALDLARELQRLQPTGAAAYGAEADVLLLDGRFEEADAAYRTASAHASTRLLALKSFLARRAGGLGDPAMPLTRWLERHPGDRRMRLILAQACAEGGQRSIAIEHYERVLASDARNPIALAGLARLRGAGGGPVSAGGSC